MLVDFGGASMDQILSSPPTGDWFNRLDFTYTTNNFGVGLPPAAKNEAAWPIKQPLLADPSLKPSSDLIKVCFESPPLS